MRAVPRGRGRARGHRQRAQQRADRTPWSPLFKYMIDNWAWGLWTATTVQAVAWQTVQSHTINGVPQSPDDIQALAALGTNGLHPQHCHSQLLNMLGVAVTIAPFVFPLSLLTLKRRHGARVVADSTHSMVSPFEYFSFLWTEKRDGFARMFLGGGGAPTTVEARERLRGWWRGVPDANPCKEQVARELVQRDDVGGVQDIWSRAVPIIIHGDAFPLSRTKINNSIALLIFSVSCRCRLYTLCIAGAPSTRCRGTVRGGRMA